MQLGQSIAYYEGLPDLRIAAYPGAFNDHTVTEIRENIKKKTLDQIIEGLTKPVKSSGGDSSTASTLNNPKKIVFEGTFEEVNEFFLKKGWTDRLPIVPPTIEKVEEFLKYTDLSPNEEIAILPQAKLRATPWNIAANAVMAGCKPEYMPVLITAVAAIGDPVFQLGSLGTTGGVVPFLVINGPIIKQLNIEYGQALTSLGPNPAIGRALGLIVNNIAGFRPGGTYMGTFGYFLPFVLAEDEKAIYEMGWKPYQVEKGFDANTSTVTAGGSVNWGGQLFPPKAVGAKDNLLAVAGEFKRQTIFTQTLTFNPRVMATVLISPPTAKVIARDYSKQDVAEYLFQNTTLTVREAKQRVVIDMQAKFPARLADKEPDEIFPVYRSRDQINILVCGDQDRDKVMAFWTFYSLPSLKEIKLPKNWDELMAKLGYPPLKSFYR